MDKRLAKKLTRIFRKDLDKELWWAYYIPDKEDCRLLKERIWRWQVVIEYKGILLFKPDIKELLGIVEDRGLSINFETKEIMVW